MQFDVSVVEGKATDIPTEDTLTLKRLVEAGKFSLDATGRIVVNLETEADEWVRTDAKMNTALIVEAKSNGGKINLPIMCTDGKFRLHSFTPEVKKQVSPNGDIRYNVANILVVKPPRKREGLAAMMRQASQAQRT